MSCFFSSDCILILLNFATIFKGKPLNKRTKKVVANLKSSGAKHSKSCYWDKLTSNFIHISGTLLGSTQNECKKRVNLTLRLKITNLRALCPLCLEVCMSIQLQINIQFPNINLIPLVERKYVTFILTIFPKNFWNKWYLIWKP